MNRFKTTKEDLQRLSSEFSIEAFPLIDKFYNTSFNILLDKKATNKILKQTYFEAIEYCDKSKANADWQNWIQRIWIREILDFYFDEENITQISLDSIYIAQANLSEIKASLNDNIFKSDSTEDQLIRSLSKTTSILRIPLILKDIHLLNYTEIATLLDVPEETIATRVYCARKLLFLYLQGYINYHPPKSNGRIADYNQIIFEVRKCALLVDDELKDEQLSEFNKTIKTEKRYENEVIIQKEIKKLLWKLSSTITPKSLIKKIKRKAQQFFVKS